MDGGVSAEWRYTKGEVLYLLSLTRGDAIDEDAGQPDSCSILSHDDLPGTTHVEWDPVFAIARWHDVQRAKKAVEARWSGIHAEASAKILELRVSEHTEEETARLVDLHRLAARRRFHAALDEILEELGGEAQESERMSRVSACMVCATRPRARRREVVRRRRGRPPLVKPERQSSLCWECAPEKLRALLIPPRRVLEAAV